MHLSDELPYSAAVQDTEKADEVLDRRLDRRGSQTLAQELGQDRAGNGASAMKLVDGVGEDPPLTSFPMVRLRTALALTGILCVVTCVGCGTTSSWRGSDDQSQTTAPASTDSPSADSEPTNSDDSFSACSVVTAAELSTVITAAGGTSVTASIADDDGVTCDYELSPSLTVEACTPAPSDSVHLSFYRKGHIVTESVTEDEERVARSWPSAEEVLEAWQATAERGTDSIERISTRRFATPGSVYLAATDSSVAVVSGFPYEGDEICPANTALREAIADTILAHADRLTG